MYIVQNLFHRGKHHRIISLNAHYMVVFKNPRDVSQIMALAHQMYPQRTKYFLEAYTAATAQPHGYSNANDSTITLYNHTSFCGLIKMQWLQFHTIIFLFHILSEFSLGMEHYGSLCTCNQELDREKL